MFGYFRLLGIGVTIISKPGVQLLKKDRKRVGIFGFVFWLLYFFYCDGFIKFDVKHTPMKPILKFIPVLVFVLSSRFAVAQIVQETFCDNGGSLDTSIVINGDFTSGNTGFSTTYNYCNTYDCLFPFTDDAYSVGTSAPYFHHIFVGTDHTTGAGNFMIINGQDSSRLAWGETVAVLPGSKYVLSLWISAMDTLPSAGAATVRLLVNGTAIGTTTIPTTTGVWTQLQGVWYSGASTTANITIKDVTSNWNGFDYGLDDITFERCIAYNEVAVVNGKDSKSVTILPNPSNGVLTISNCPSNANIDIYDATGRKILTTATGNQTSSTIDITNYPSGLYLVHISSAKEGIFLSKCVMIGR